MKIYEFRLKFHWSLFPRGPINNIPALVQKMAWRRLGDKPLSEPMMVNLLTHICVTRPQWVNKSAVVFLCNYHALIFWKYLKPNSKDLTKGQWCIMGSHAMMSSRWYVNPIRHRCTYGCPGTISKCNTGQIRDVFRRSLHWYQSVRKDLAWYCYLSGVKDIYQTLALSSNTSHIIAVFYGYLCIKWVSINIVT